MRFNFTQLWTIYQEKKEARKRAIVTKADLDQWIQGALVYRRRLRTMTDEEWFYRVAESLLDYAHATYEPRELAKFLNNIVDRELSVREYDARQATKNKAEAQI